MSETYFIAGAIFTLLSIVWWFIKKNDKRGKAYDKAINDLDKAADDRDWDAIDDARHRMWKNK
jgi:hypothetical protein